MAQSGVAVSIEDDFARLEYGGVVTIDAEVARLEYVGDLALGGGDLALEADRPRPEHRRGRRSAAAEADRARFGTRRPRRAVAVDAGLLSPADAFPFAPERELRLAPAAEPRAEARPRRRPLAAESPVDAQPRRRAASAAGPRRSAASAAPVAAPRHRLQAFAPAVDPTTPGRRTVTIRGRGDERYVPPRRSADRRPERRYERTGFRPDRTAMWAVLLGLMLVLAAVASAHAAVIH